MLLLNINRETNMGSPMLLSNLTLGDIGRSKSKELTIRNIISCKGAELLKALNYYKTLVGNHIFGPMTLSNLILSDLDSLKPKSFRY